MKKKKVTYNNLMKIITDTFEKVDVRKDRLGDGTIYLLVRGKEELLREVIGYVHANYITTAGNPVAISMYPCYIG